MHRPDHGFYQVGNLTCASKIQAILEAERQHSFPHFVFNDEIYSRFDWTVEPAETLDQLYTRRAWELREKYDYLVLHFSGGSDSANILETFIRNKIPLEELFIRGPWKTSDKNIHNHDPSNQHAEAWFTSWPLANWVKDNHYPNIKITVTDTTQYLVDYFVHNSDWHERLVLNSLTPGTVWKADYDLVETSYRDLSNRGLKVGHILGVEKPMVFYNQGRYHVKFLDKLINIMIPGRCTTAQEDYNVEAFYWGETTAPLIIKQAHAVKRCIKDNNLDPKILQNKGRQFQEWLANVIYDRSLPLPFTTNKSAYQAMVIDKFFFADTDSLHMKNFSRGVDALTSMLPDRWKEYTPFCTDLVGIWSREYDVGS
jgi:hypothetical protein